MSGVETQRGSRWKPVHSLALCVNVAKHARICRFSQAQFNLRFKINEFTSYNIAVSMILKSIKRFYLINQSEVILWGIYWLYNDNPDMI